MLTYRSHLITREGWRFITFAALLSLVLHIAVGFFIAIPFWIATLVLCFLFRDPTRKVPPKPLAIVSPVDGRVIGIDTQEDPYTETPVVHIQLSKGFFDVMTTRSPMEGRILKQWFGTNNAQEPVGESNIEVGMETNTLEGCELSSKQPAISSMKNRICRFAQWIQSDEQDNVVMAVKSATRIFKPRCYSHSGDRIGQGQRCGFIPLKAVVQVSVPVSSRVEVKIGDTVRGGSDTLATLVH